MIWVGVMGYKTYGQTSRKRDQKGMQEDGKGCCEMLAIAHVNSQHMWLPSQDLYNMEPGSIFQHERGRAPWSATLS